nr:FAD-dependent oxidoreductase [Cupriavidus sp. YR651]
MDVVDAEHIVVVGGGAAGIAVASSLRAREPELDIAIIDPADVHYYQPGWTLVGAGVFEAAATARTMASRVPAGVRWLKGAVVAFEPERNALCSRVAERCAISAWSFAQASRSTGTALRASLKRSAAMA